MGYSNFVIDILSLEDSNFHGQNATGPAVVYKEGGATDLTSIIKANEGANVFIRRSNERNMVKPSVCPKTHCPDSFQYSIG